jgi:ribosomal-protein-alanine N-acetyltransferase
MNHGGTSIEIRAMKAADIERVVEIAAGLEQAPHWPRRVYEGVLENTSARRIALVAEALPGGAAAGMIVASWTAPEAELETIAVTASAQRRGVGRQLIGALEIALRQEGVSELNLEVRASNGKAIAFYGSVGFLESGRRRGYYAEPVEDAVLMRKEISRP